MKKVFVLLSIALPAFGFAQCPSFIGQPVDNVRPFMLDVAGTLQTSFTDSAIQGNNAIVTFSDADEKCTFKVFSKNNKITSINIVAEKSKLDALTEWFKTEHAACQVSQAGQWIKYKDFMIVWQDVGSKTRSLTIEGK